MALNGNPRFSLPEAISMFVSCETQAEIDELWTKLTADGGAPSRCGWLKDKFGLSWQLIPAKLGTLLYGSDPARARRVMDALLKMDKLDLATLEQAYAGR
jgi:predicted 3-demethylubiquinone-9 3-methyltransferase (glyoxalase superfamily)